MVSLTEGCGTSQLGVVPTRLSQSYVVDSRFQLLSAHCMYVGELSIGSISSADPAYGGNKHNGSDYLSFSSGISRWLSQSRSIVTC